jgi:PTH2 family peptidyl-tRNA hydrolase
MKMMIVVRKDLNMRKGKMIAQGAHAACGILTSGEVHPGIMGGWASTGAAKIAVSVSSEDELLTLHAQAKDANLPVYLVRDAGRTEFHGEPTYTALAIGPAPPSELDPITGNLKLL